MDRYECIKTFKNSLYEIKECYQQCDNVIYEKKDYLSLYCSKTNIKKELVTDEKIILTVGPLRCLIKNVHIFN
jgi:hypothetical protein